MRGQVLSDLLGKDCDPESIIAPCQCKRQRQNGSTDRVYGPVAHQWEKKAEPLRVVQTVTFRSTTLSKQQSQQIGAAPIFMSSFRETVVSSADVSRIPFVTEQGPRSSVAEAGR